MGERARSVARRRTRRDAAEGPIVSALVDVGATVSKMDRPVDLLVGYRGRTYLLEIKNPGEGPRADQQKWMDRWRGQVEVVHTPHEALKSIGALEPIP